MGLRFNTSSVRISSDKGLVHSKNYFECLMYVFWTWKYHFLTQTSLNSNMNFELNFIFLIFVPHHFMAMIFSS